MYRRERFGGLAYEATSEEFFFLNRKGFNLLSEIPRGGVSVAPQSLPHLSGLIDTGLIAPRQGCPNHAGQRGLWKSDEAPDNGCLISPTHVELYPLLHCNHRCRFCYVGFEVENPSHPPMARQSIERLVSNLESAGVFNVTILGGEPFLYPHLDVLLDRLIASGFDTAISTNGTIHEPRLLEQIRHGNVKLNIALHGDGAGVHDALVQRPGAFSSCVETIRTAARIGIPFNITCVLTKGLMRQPERMVELVHSLGGHGLTLSFPQRAAYSTQNGMDISFQEYEEAYGHMHSRGMKIGVHVKSGYHYDFLIDGDLSAFDPDNPLADYMYGDRVGRYSLEVLPNGDAYPSYEFFNRPEWRVGNLLTDDLRSIWANSPALELLRSRGIPRQCRSCEYVPVCRGGLLSRNALQGNLDLPADDCPILAQEAVAQTSPVKYSLPLL